MEGLVVGGWFASAVINKLADKLRSYIGDQYEYQTSSIKGKLKSLEGNMTKIQAAIHTADQRQTENPGLKKWFMDLKDACYDAEDVVDMFEYQLLKDGAKGKKLSKDSHTIVKRFLFRDDNLNELLAIVDRFDNLVNQLSGFLHLLSLDRASREKQGKSHKIIDWRLTDSDFIEPQLFGRRNERTLLIDLLLEKGRNEGGNSRKIVHVLPIVGIGGVGKTTLAQAVYNEQRLQQYFDLTAWVCVSDKFELRRVITEIMESASIGKPPDFYKIKSLDKIRSILKEGLMGKRFLIVLDDVWDEDPDKWEKLLSALESGDKGSKVIITTRNHTIADIMGTKVAMTLRGLSEQEYWNFFVHCAFGDKNPEDHPSLEFFGRKIVKKLGGLPLAAKVVGSALKSNLKEDHWQEVLESKLWQLDQQKDGILPVLRLSYDYLPGYLKQCFVYCSLFPKNYSFSKKQLVQLWIAQGFIQPNDAKMMEKIGEAYFNELLSRSLFQKIPLDYYVIHDLVHDLAVYLSDGESYRADDNLSENKPVEISKKVRHAYISSNNLLLVCNNEHAKKKLRSLVVFGPYGISLDMLKELKGLRVLILKDVNQKLSSESFKQMLHLRYLELIGHTNQAYELPESLSKLYHLQLLSLESSNFWLSDFCSCAIFPKGINRLINLRHLCAYTGKIAGIGTLTSLQELRFYVKEKGKGFEIEQLRDMSQLRELWIEGLESVKSKEEAYKAKLCEKGNLQDLRLEWGRGSHADGVLEGLQPHENLKKLLVNRYNGNCPTWWNGNWQSYLNEIRLVGCSNWETLAPMGHLPLLKVLYLDGMNAVKRIGPEFYGSSSSITTSKAFPSLELLCLRRMSELMEWCDRVEGLELFPRLSGLSVAGCPKLRGPLCLLYPLRAIVIQITEHESDFYYPEESHLAVFCPSVSMLKEWIPWQNLASVESVEFGSTEKLTTFTIELEEWFQHFTSLKSLRFNRCNQLRSLPSILIKSLSTLQELTLYRCDGIQSLPKEGLPSSLTELCIKGIELGKRCKKGGPDWHKIAHIPNIIINDVEEQRLANNKGSPEDVYWQNKVHPI